MEKGRGKGTDTLATDKVFTRKEYIEREAAKKVICDYCSCVQLCSRNENDCWAIEALQAIPAADVVPVRHGKWETAFLAHEYLGCRPYAHYCSVCHQIIAFRTFYCPNCGARMDGDGECATEYGTV